MKLHRFIINETLESGKLLRVSDEDVVKQIRNVLRLRIGDKLVLGDGASCEAVAEIQDFGNGFIMFKVLEISQNKSESEADITLYCSVLKRDNFELVVQKTTEVGIKEIVPIVAKRTVKLNLNLERLRIIAKEAAEQSGRAVVPKIHEVISFNEAVKNAGGVMINHNTLFDISGEPINDLKLKTKNLKLNLWVGPEGGWDESELTAAKEAGFKIVSLGKLTLRAETAAIIATYVAISD
ncbi:MAG: 16S rRNA (uracil(1498)-N(3))-methyltransferase [Candidatus Colwellbacteria bacterium]|nr:16S rRNA (uracil(1498)-N(3))-methyltransferase [Candidatus Colwellbacteria bacterium]